MFLNDLRFWFRFWFWFWLNNSLFLGLRSSRPFPSLRSAVTRRNIVAITLGEIDIVVVTFDIYHVTTNIILFNNHSILYNDNFFLWRRFITIFAIAFAPTWEATK